jgi:hypothetical protein
VAAVISEAPTPVEPIDEPTGPVDPTGEVEVAGAPMSQPNPFVLFGTLLFALAAAAGQMLRHETSFFRRLIHGFDGVRGHAPGASGGAPPVESASTLSQTAIGVEAYQTVAGEAHLTQPGGSTSYATTPDLSAAHSGGGLGGHGGGLDSLAKGSANGIDGLAKGGPNGLHANGLNANGFDANGLSSNHLGSADPGLSHDIAGNSLGHGGDVQADVMGHNGHGISDWGVGGPSGSEVVQQPSPNGSLGGSGTSDALARTPGGSGSQFAPGGSGSEFAHGGVNGHGGLGGSHGSEAMARGIGGSGDALAHGTNGSSHALGHQAVTPGDALGNGAGGSGGSLGPDASLNESLETLARSLPAVDGSALADAGNLTVQEGVQALGSVEPSWLGAGALAKAASDVPLPRAVRCPACDRPLEKPNRFCGYCGEPLDKTMI